jgi:cardiolipin synthase
VVAAGLVAGDVALRVAALAVVPRNRRPSSALAWLLAINLMPYAGPLAFAVIGYPQLPRARREKQRRMDELIHERTIRTTEVDESQARPPQWLAPVTRMNRRLGAMPFLGGNSATLHPGGTATLAEMAAEVDRAQRFVHAEFYLFEVDASTTPFVEALGRAVERGVTVRVLLDHLASLRSRGYATTRAELTRRGVQWRLMLPLQPLRGKVQRPDLRNHRKLLVVDGEVGWTGSQNMIDPSYNRRDRARGLQWVDLVVRFEGPVVAELDAVFVTDWYSETDELLPLEERSTPVAHPDQDDGDLDCQVVPSGPGFPGENNLKLFIALLHSAQREVVLTTPYFVPDESLLAAITTAAERGLSVELFVCEEGDQWLVHHAQCSYYEALLRAGVRIWLYPAPFVLHAKHISVDGQIVVVGSSNMDIRSFTLDLEVSVMVRGDAFVEALREVQDGYRARSRELTLAEWSQRPRGQRMLDGVARLTSALQ